MGGWGAPLSNCLPCNHIERMFDKSIPCLGCPRTFMPDALLTGASFPATTMAQWPMQPASFSYLEHFQRGEK